jgi:hypothetical protein
MRRATSHAMLKLNTTVCQMKRQSPLVVAVALWFALSAAVASTRMISSPSVQGAAQVTYTPPGTGAVTQTLQTELERDGIWANDFGACQPGSTDDHVALQNAIAAGTLVRIPILRFTGVCAIQTALSVTTDLEIRGTGTGSSVLFGNAVNIDLIDVDTPAAVYFHDFTLEYGAPAKAGTQAISVTAGASQENKFSKFERLQIASNVQVGINFLKASFFHISDSVITANLIAVAVANTNFADSGDSTIDGGTLLQAGPGGYCVYWVSSGGLKIANIKCLGLNMAGGIAVALANGGSTSVFLLTASSIEGIATTGAAVLLTHAGTGNGFGSVVIGNNELTGGLCLSIPTNGSPWISTGSVNGNVCNIFGTGLAAFAVDSATNFGFTGNVIINNGAASNSKYKIGPNATTIYVGPTVGIGNFAASTYNASTTIDDPFGTAFAGLPSAAANGSRFFVTDGAPASSPCTGSSSGSTAFRQNGAWKCF